MSDLPQPEQWYATIVTSLKRRVFPEILEQLLTFARMSLKNAPDYQQAIPHATHWLAQMQSDADLTFWILNRAQVPEAVVVHDAVELVLALARFPTQDTERFPQLAASLQADCSLLGVARIGLQWLARLS